MTPNGKADWSFLLPERARTEKHESALFIRAEATWIALLPIHLTIQSPDGKAVKQWPNTQAMSAKGSGEKICGFATEIGEKTTHGSYEHFKKAIARSAHLNLTQLAEGRVAYQGSQGRRVQIEVSDPGLPRVIRDGEIASRDKVSWALWRPVDDESAPLSLGWKTGKLHVAAGGRVFEATFTNDGQYAFENR